MADVPRITIQDLDVRYRTRDGWVIDMGLMKAPIDVSKVFTNEYLKWVLVLDSRQIPAPGEPCR